jgi:hypothetical protein
MQSISSSRITYRYLHGHYIEDYKANSMEPFVKTLWVTLNVVVSEKGNYLVHNSASPFIFYEFQKLGKGTIPQEYEFYQK